MNEELKQTLKEYESIKLQMKELEDKLTEMKPVLLENIPEGTDVVTDFGKFSVTSRSKWIFSEGLTSDNENLKKLQKEEKADGTAKEEKGIPYIVYKQSK